MSGIEKPSAMLLDEEFLKTVERLTLAVGHPFSGRARPARRSAGRLSADNTAEAPSPRARRTVSPSSAPPPTELPIISPATSPEDLETAALCHVFRTALTAIPHLRLSILLDAGQSMALPAALGEIPKFQYARRLVAALGFAALIRYQQVRVVCFAPRTGARTPTLRGRESAPALLRYLENVRPGGESFARSLEHFSTRQSHANLCIVVSDFLDPQWEKGIRALLSRHFHVVLLQTLTPSEMEPHIGEDLRLVDADTGQIRAINLGERANAQYQEALSSFFGMLGDAAGKHGMEYLRVTTSTPFEEALLSTLRAASLPRRS